MHKGMVIAIPIVNIYGFINFSRAVPDGKDVNRSFPGSLKGSLASRVARVITTKILPHVDYIIDLHTGGGSRFNHPQIRYSAKDDVSFKLAKIFNAPFIIKKPVIIKSLRKIAREKKIPVIIFEGGESLRFDGYSIQLATNGIINVLNSFGMLSHPAPPKEKMVHFTKTVWIRASKSGLFMWTKSSGQRVLKNEIIGIINDPQGTRSTAVLASKSGYIIGHNNASVVNQGDALYHISYDYEILD
jgi:predicted deacylase